MNCSLINDTLVDIAQIIEQSAYEAIQEQLKMENITIELVYVKSLCQVLVQSHEGYSGISSRRLKETNMTDIKLFTTVSQACTSCEDLIFNKTAAEILRTVQDNSLSTKIHNKTNGTIQSVISPNVTSSFKVIQRDNQRCIDPAPSCEQPEEICMENVPNCDPSRNEWTCVLQPVVCREDNFICTCNKI